MLFPGSGSHQASLITRPARSSLLYTDFESTALFRLSAEKKNPSPRQIPSTDLALPVNLFIHYYIGAYGVPVTVRACGLRLLVPDPSPSLLIDAPVWVRRGFYTLELGRKLRIFREKKIKK